jgi:preprotein translocase subunit SecF
VRLREALPNGSGPVSDGNFSQWLVSKLYWCRSLCGCMELFKQTDINFLGKVKWPFIIASVVLLAGGFGSLVVHGGPRYGIDFKGGALVYVKFAESPPIEKIRAALASRLPGGTPDIQEITGTSEIIIGTELSESAELESGRRAILETLASLFPSDQGKLDINSASQQSLMDRLRGPLLAAGVNLNEQQLKDLAASILNFRDTPPRSGLIRNFDQLAGVPGVNQQVISVLKQQATAVPYAIRNTEVVGPKIGAELRQQAVLATLYALGGMLVYIAFRFEWVSGVAAVIAVLHDTLVTVGLLSIFDFEVSLTVVAALLTLVGYSMNDKIVVFDRVRENLKLMKRETLANLINVSINQTLSRTVLTGGLTLLSAICLLIFGGPILRGFAFAFVVGIIVGTYSSIFIATPIVVLVQKKLDERKRRSYSGPSGPAAPGAGGGAVRRTPARAVK